jgi:hypothetical protein
MQRPDPGTPWAPFDSAGGPDRIFVGASEPGDYMLQGVDGDGNPVVADSNIVHKV